MEKIRVSLPVIVEGRYDKSALCSIFDATVVTTNGFGVFKSNEKRALIKKLAERGGIILLTDSDAGGKQIRSFLSGILPSEKIFHLYIPEIKGKEKRKKAPSKAGLLGVEGVGREVLVKLLAPFSDIGACREKSRDNEVTKLDFFRDGLSGGEGSRGKRDELARSLDLPSGMSANALLGAINLISCREEYERAVQALSSVAHASD